MNYKYKIGLFLLFFSLIFTACNRKTSNPNDNTEKNLTTTPSLTVTPTPTPTPDTDPFHLRESDEPYPFQSHKDGVKKFGYLKLNGDIMIEPTYQKAGFYYKNVAVILTDKKDKKTGERTPLYKVIDKEGGVLFKSNALIQDFYNGYAIYADEDNSYYQGYIDIHGEVAITPRFLVAYPFNEEGEAYALTNQEVYVRINTKGEVLKTYAMDTSKRSYTFPDGFLIYTEEKNNKMGVIHLDGTSILDPIYGEITYLGNNLFAVKEFEKGFDTTLSVTKPSAIVRRNGEALTDYIYYDITPFTNGYASATDDTSTFLIGLDGKKSTDMPTLSGRGTMTVIGELIQATIDNEMIYLDAKGNLLWESNAAIQLNDEITVHYEKYKSNKYILIYYPSISGLEDLEIQTIINDELKAKFTSNRLPNTDDDTLTVSDDFDVSLRKNIFIVHHSGYDYSLGAAHGIPLSRYYYIDLTNGKFYGLSDLFRNDVDYVSGLNTIIKKDLNKQMEEDDSFLLNQNFKTIAKDQPFYLKDDSLVIYFEPNEIAAYAAGFPEVVIPFDQIEELIDQEGPFWQGL